MESLRGNEERREDKGDEMMTKHLFCTLRMPAAQTIKELSEYQGEFEILINAGEVQPPYRRLGEQMEALEAFLKPGRLYHVHVGVSEITPQTPEKTIDP